MGRGQSQPELRRSMRLYGVIHAWHLRERRHVQLGWRDSILLSFKACFPSTSFAAWQGISVEERPSNEKASAVD